MPSKVDMMMQMHRMHKEWGFMLRPGFTIQENYERALKEKAERTLLLNNTAVCPGGAWVVTKYPDGTEVHAHPNHNEDSEAIARALGYPNVDYQTLKHDPMHHVVSQLLLGHPSPVVKGMEDPELSQAEEEVVFALERYMNLLKEKGLVGAERYV